MFKNYLIVALRNLAKYKVYSLINVFGLAIGLMTSLLLTLYIVDEFTFDQHYENSDRLYRLIPRIEIPGQSVRRVDVAPGGMGTAIARNFPEIENSTKLAILGRADMTYGDNSFYEPYLAATSSIFEHFDFEFLQGDSASVLEQPNAVLVTESAATKYFGDEEPMGKTLISNRGEFEVVGVLRDLPSNSHLQFDLMFSFPAPIASVANDWADFSFYTYFLVNENADIEELQNKIGEFVAEDTPEQLRGIVTPELQAIEDIHFGSSDIENTISLNNGSIDTIITLTGIVVFILFIACINYVNLATARSVNRSNEIGLRKVVGAERKQLVVQFLSESVLLTSLAFVIALVLTLIALPAFSEFTGKELSLNSVFDPSLLYLVVVAAILIGVCAGTYPSFYLANIRILSAMKVRQTSESASISLRKGLVVIQFCLSVILLVATFIAQQQMQFIQDKPLGFNENNLVVMDINSGNSRDNYQAIKNEFLTSPNVSSVSVSSRVPGEWKNMEQVDIRLLSEQDIDNRVVTFIGADNDFLQTFDIELVAGRNFLASESTTYNLIVNRVLAAQFGWTAQEAVGQQVHLSDAEDVTATIVGIVEDFHFRSLHEEIGPLILGNSHTPVQAIDYFTAKINAVDVANTLQHLQRSQNLFDSETPFEYHFLDEQIAIFYENDRLTTSLFGVASLLAVLIACLGLYGLSAFATEQRSKEIGVRKILGASVSQLLQLLTLDFVKLVILANVIAWPVVYYLMNLWLNSFAYHEVIGLTNFVLAGSLLVVAALVTVGGHTIRVALANPVESIRYE